MMWKGDRNVVEGWPQRYEVRPGRYGRATATVTRVVSNVAEAQDVGECVIPGSHIRFPQAPHT